MNENQNGSRNLRSGVELGGEVAGEVSKEIVELTELDVVGKTGNEERADLVDAMVGRRDWVRRVPVVVGEWRRIVMVVRPAHLLHPSKN